MNVDELIKQSGNKKNLTRESIHTEVDLQTKEIKRVIERGTITYEAEPEYIKLYTGFQLLFNNLDPSLSPYIIAFGAYMTYANHKDAMYRLTVRTDKMARLYVSDVCGVGDDRVKQVIRKLVDAHIFIPIVYTDNGNKKRMRGVYYVNPWVMAKGEWKDIKALRSEFEFVTGATATMAVDEDGTRKVIVPYQYREKENGQLTMFDDGESQEN